MKKLLFILFLPIFSYGQGHFPIGGSSDTIDMYNIMQKGTGRAYYQNGQASFNPNDFSSVGYVNSTGNKNNTDPYDNYAASGFNLSYNANGGSASERVILKKNNDTLVNFFRLSTAQGHINDSGKIMMRFFAVATSTWTTPVEIFNSIYDDRNIAAYVTSTGRFLVFFRQYNTGTSTQIDMGYIYSDDGGATWSSFNSLTSLSTKVNPVPFSNIYEIAGELYFSVYNTGWCNLFKSSNNGTGWSYFSTPYDVGVSPAYTEPEFNHLGGDSVICLIRLELSTFRQMTSLDKGATWSSPVATNITGNMYPVAPFIHYDYDQDELVTLATGRYSGARAFNAGIYIYINEKNEVWNSPTSWRFIDSIRRPLAVGINYYGYPSAVKINDSTFFGISTESWEDRNSANYAGSTQQANLYEFSINYRTKNTLDPDKNISGFAFWDAPTQSWKMRDLYQGFSYNPISQMTTPVGQGVLSLPTRFDAPTAPVLENKSLNNAFNFILYGNGKSKQISDDTVGGIVHTAGIINTSSTNATGDVVTRNSSTGVYNIRTLAQILSDGNAYVQNGNTFGDTARLGPNDAFAQVIRTNGINRATILANGMLGLNRTPRSTYALDLTHPGAATEVLASFNIADNNTNHLTLFNNTTGSTQLDIAWLAYQGNSGRNVLQFLPSMAAAADNGNVPMMTLNFGLNDPLVTARAAVVTKPLLAVQNNGANLMTWLPSGNVGIGDASPASLFTVGSGDLFQVNSAGKIARSAGSAITNGELLIGHTANGTFEKATLTAGYGIGITNGAGSITTSADTASSNGLVTQYDVRARAYIPTITNVSNILSSAIADSMLYTVQGNIVTVFGKVTMNPNAAGSMSIRITLPVVSNFTNTTQLFGTATQFFGNGILEGDDTNDEALIIVPTGLGGDFYINFRYKVL